MVIFIAKKYHFDKAVVTGQISKKSNAKAEIEIKSYTQVSHLLLR